MAPKLLSTAQAAERLGVSRRRVRQLVKDGRIKAMPFGDDNRQDRNQPKMWLISEKDLEEFALRPRLPGGAGVKVLRESA